MKSTERHVLRIKSSELLVERVTSTFRLEEYVREEASKQSCGLKEQLRLVSSGLHGVISQKRVAFIVWRVYLSINPPSRTYKPAKPGSANSSRTRF
jgi:hypothetical protein